MTSQKEKYDDKQEKNDLKQKDPQSPEDRKGDHDDRNELEDRLFRELQELVGESILIVTESDQLNLFGQTFRPVFCGTVYEVKQGHLTLFPVNIKLINAPFFQFPTPLSFPLEKIAHFTPNFDCNARIPLT